MVLSAVGMMTSRRLHGNGTEEVKASRHKITNGFVLMIFYLTVTKIMLITLMSAALLFTFFNHSPSQWLESTYFTKRIGQQTQTINKQYRALPLDFI